MNRLEKRHGEREIISYGFFILDSENYRDVYSRIKIQDTLGYKYFPTLANFRKTVIKNKGRLLPFSIYNPHSIENLILWMSDNRNDIEFLEGRYLGSNKKCILVKCLTCSQGEWVTPESIRKGTGCGECHHGTLFRNLGMDRPDLLSEWDTKSNGELTPFDFRPYSDYRAYWKCSDCSHKWRAAISARNQKNRPGSNCPRCNTNSSKLSDEVERVLSKYSIKFFREKTFHGLRNRFPLKFDFYIPNRGICIESQGEQHYQPVEIFGGKEAFLRQLENDEIKRCFCYENGLDLIEIPYWEYTNVEKILIRKLDI